MKVVYTGADDTQATWAGCDDPRPDLIVGETYEVTEKEVHTWHTKYHINGKKYNSVCFKVK